MSDRASASLTIYACPEEHHAAVLTLIGERYGTVEWSEPTGDTLALGVMYTFEEECLGFESEMGAALEAVTDQIVYEATQDSVYEFDGAVPLPRARPGLLREHVRRRRLAHHLGALRRPGHLHHHRQG